MATGEQQPSLGEQAIAIFMGMHQIKTRINHRVETKTSLLDGYQSDADRTLARAVLHQIANDKPTVPPHEKYRASQDALHRVQKELEQLRLAKRYLPELGGEADEQLRQLLGGCTITASVLGGVPVQFDGHVTGALDAAMPSIG